MQAILLERTLSFIAMVRFHGLILFLHFVLFRELEKQRESSASNIAKKKQEAEAAVSI